MAKRIKHTAAFKAKVARAALKEDKTLSELGQEFKVHSVQIAKWKSIVSDGMEGLFEDKRKKIKNPEEDVEALYAQIGKLQAKLEFLKKKTGIED
jgi:transposase-like protein